jgi:glycosyltransferase involved in cell wall biosynthesis
LILLGDGPERPELTARIQKYGLTDKVLLAGIREDTAPWYRVMDVFVLSSATEQMPVALLEAMASGLPALCTDVGDCSSLLDSQQPPVIVQPGDAAAYANALTVLASDPGLRKSLGERNRQRCERLYTLPHMLKRYKSLYQSAITGLSPIPPAA